MNHSFSIIAGVGIGIVIGIFLEKQFKFNIEFDIGNAAKDAKENLKKGNSKKQSKSKKSASTLYNKSGKYQDQSKAGKGKGLTKESKTGNIE